jgi:hypothetical protein
MIRRVSLASLVVVAFALAGASAGPVRPLQSLRLVVSIAWLNAPDEGERETQPLAAHVAQPPAIAASRVRQSAGVPSSAVERWRFQRPPPPVL